VSKQSILGAVPKELPSVNLNRDVTKHLKRGHRWVFASGIDETRNLPSGFAKLMFKNELIGIGIFQSDTQLKFRLLCLAEEPFFRPNGFDVSMRIWAEQQWAKAVKIRSAFDRKQTNSFRLINGEGDGMPGLVIDIYDAVAVIKHDHPVMEKVWIKETVAEWIQRDLPFIQTIYLKRRNDEEEKGVLIKGHLEEQTQFLENGLKFSSHIRNAAKTGFFLDQRDNRHLIRSIARDLRVLNLFSYTGGFSIAAAAGGAQEVTSVDIAKAAIEAVDLNFRINNLGCKHTDIATDAFKYVEEQILKKLKFDLVITDPPSFAPNEKSVPQATAAYTRIFSDSIKLVSGNGLFAASSCSSHISSDMFMEICKEAVSKARRRATVVYIGGQPVDHPFPLAMEELRYLKFILFRLD
jgi:23S rRNA (cytosine1962-C5)-methyltransferase